MSKINVIFVSTCVDHSHIYKLIESVFNFNSHISVKLIVVNQCSEKIEFKRTNDFTELVLIEYGRNVNTSVARNIGIEYILKSNYNFDFICFPDDDSSYDSLFFLGIKEFVDKKIFNNFVTDIYCTGTRVLFRTISLRNGTKLSKSNFDIVGAVNIVINYETFKKVRFFDERFGVNAKYGAGEDGDYFLRAIAYDYFYYSKQLFSYHPSGFGKFKSMSYQKQRLKLRSYGIGVIALLCKHKMYFEAVVTTFRAIGGIFFSIYQLQFSLALAYLEAFFVRLFSLTKFLIFPLK